MIRYGKAKLNKFLIIISTFLSGLFVGLLLIQTALGNTTYCIIDFIIAVGLLFVAVMKISRRER